MTQSGNGPDPMDPYPMEGFAQVGFLRPLFDAPGIEIGDYTYYDDPDGPEHFVSRCVHYHFPFIGDRLVIGRYCALARGVSFLMNGANHAMDGFSTYPFAIFGKGWGIGPDDEGFTQAHRGDTIVGNDVWIGREATILPGVTIGDGAIIGARSVVGSDVAPYSIVAGNPARVVRMRFPDAVIAELLAIAWWNWDAATVTRHLDAIRGADLAALRAVA